VTFSSEVAREQFHKLPTEVQVTYARLEEFLANTGKYLQCHAVTTDLKTRLDVLVCISEKLYNTPASAD